MDLLNLVFPKTCLGCGKGGSYLCLSCTKKEKLLKPVCPYCEKPSIDGFTHSKCQRVFGLDGLTSIWDYGGVIKKAILAFKFKYATEIGKELGESFVRELVTRTIPVKEAIIVPIPLFWYRKNVRGFNQSVEIGEQAAKTMGWNFIPDLLIKKRPTTSQVELSVVERMANLKGVFAINPNIKYPVYSILLFDDVFTTGSTLKEAAKVLKRAGVQKVWGLTIAR